MFFFGREWCEWDVNYLPWNVSKITEAGNHSRPLQKVMGIKRKKNQREHTPAANWVVRGYERELRLYLCLSPCYRRSLPFVLFLLQLTLLDPWQVLLILPNALYFSINTGPGFDTDLFCKVQTIQVTYNHLSSSLGAVLYEKWCKLHVPLWIGECGPVSQPRKFSVTQSTGLCRIFIFVFFSLLLFTFLGWEGVVEGVRRFFIQLHRKLESVIHLKRRGIECIIK